MKRILSLALFLLPLVCLGQRTVDLSCIWTANSPDENVYGYNVYYSTNSATGPWLPAVPTTIPAKGTNGVPAMTSTNQLTVTKFPVIKSWWCGTAVNEYGESDKSEVVFWDALVKPSPPGKQTVVVVSVSVNVKVDQ